MSEPSETPKTPRELRKERGLRQNAVATTLELRKNTYCMMERGDRRYPLDVALRISAFYGLPFERIDFLRAWSSRHANPRVHPAEAAAL